MPRVTKRTTKKKSTPVKSSGSLLSQAKTVEFDKDDPFSIGIFGLPATGKTTVTSTFPKPILMMTCSGGIKKPGELRSIAKADRKHVKQIVIEDCEQLPKICEELKDSEFKTASLDHLTSFSDLVLSQILGVDRVKPQLAWGDVQQQQWQKHGSLMKAFLRDLIELPMFTTIISHERVFEPKEGSELGVPKAGPAVTPTVAGWLTGTLDFCIQMFTRDLTEEKEVKVAGKTITKRRKTGETEFCAYLPLSEDRMTKFRKPRGKKLDPVMTDPTFDKLQALMED